MTRLDELAARLEAAGIGFEMRDTHILVRDEEWCLRISLSGWLASTPLGYMETWPVDFNSVITTALVIAAGIPRKGQTFPSEPGGMAEVVS